jgi:hypothetical protein
MRMADQPMSAPMQHAASTRPLLLTTFIATVVLSASLLFMVQPMFTKLVLPRFGGAPSVWSVAIVFFQTALLAGYAYAHWLTRYAPGRSSVAIHLLVMGAAMFVLPLSIATGWERPPAGAEALWLMGLLALSIGLPFFALAANSPLLQAWFARTDHPAAQDPYFLYAASNVGSFLALVTYPTVIEPLVRLEDQARVWSIGFCLLVVVLAACGVMLWRSPQPAAPAERATDTPPTWKDAAFWVALAAVPAGLLVAVTAHISTDVAAVPLLWTLPLALYLLTFVFAFARRPIIPHRFVVAVQAPCIIALVAVIIFEPIKNIMGVLAVHLTVFFVNALMCHGELARTRPPAKYLTAFYLWISAGGVIGGVATALIAPHLFNWVAEYPILIALAALCRPDLGLPRDRRRRYLLFGGTAVAAVVLVVWLLNVIDETALTWAVAALLGSAILLWRIPLAFAAVIAFALLVHHSVIEQDGAISVRSFFGVSRVFDTADGQFRLLQHGTTLHGGQRIRQANGEPAARPEPLLYYWDGSAISQALEAVRARLDGPMRFAVIGLGAGALACRAGPQDTVRYYEIDPAIVQMARAPHLFSFLRNCRPDVPIILGDARLTLAEAPDGAYDLIIVDAFSSDAIPIHLLTREAMAIYLKKLSAHGVVVMHVSNRHLELASVVAGIAAANGLMTRTSEGADIDEAANPYKFTATVAAVARSEEDFGALAQSADWTLESPDPNQRVWSDDYCNIVGAVIRKLRQ